MGICLRQICFLSKTQFDADISERLKIKNYTRNTASYPVSYNCGNSEYFKAFSLFLAKNT